MAKTDSLLYIKRYLKTLENVEETECVHSTYYKVGTIKIRVSNHAKKQTKTTNRFDIGIVQALNDNKLYIVSIRGSLAMNIMNLTQLKEFVRNYILISQMNKFQIEDYADDEIKEMRELTEVKEIKTTKEDDEMILSDMAMLSFFIEKRYNWYRTKLTKQSQKHLRDFIKSNVKDRERLNILLDKVHNIIIKNSAKKHYDKNDIELLLKTI